MTLTFIQGHKCVKLDYFLTCNISGNTQAISFKLGMMVLVRGRLMDAILYYMLMLVLMTLTFMQGHSGSAKAKTTSVECSWQLSKL